MCKKYNIKCKLKKLPKSLAKYLKKTIRKNVYLYFMSIIQGKSSTNNQIGSRKISNNFTNFC